jgi:hypothetical protein
MPMQERMKIVGRGFVVCMALFVAIAWWSWPTRTEAASIASYVGKLERNTAQLERIMQSSTLSKPYSLYNQTKKSYAEAKKATARLKNGPTKRQYSERTAKAYRTIQRAAYYISAIESGERLVTLKSRLDQALSSGNVDVVYDVYPLFEQQLKKTAVLVNKVEYSSVRQKMVRTFQRPAEVTKQRTFFPINIMLAFDKIVSAYEKEDIDEAERLIALCEQWISQVKDANTKKALNSYLEEFKTPVVLEVE